MNTPDDNSGSLNRALAHEIISASGAQSADNVTIAGIEHLEVMIELIRRGFSHVLCRSADRGPHMGVPPTDILIAPNVKSEAVLRDVVTRLGYDLRPRGILLISCAYACSSLNEQRVRRLLMECGFTAVERITVRDDVGTIWCAHKKAASMPRAA